MPPIRTERSSTPATIVSVPYPSEHERVPDTSSPEENGVPRSSSGPSVENSFEKRVQTTSNEENPTDDGQPSPMEVDGDVTRDEERGSDYDDSPLSTPPRLGPPTSSVRTSSVRKQPARQATLVASASKSLAAEDSGEDELLSEPEERTPTPPPPKRRRSSAKAKTPKAPKEPKEPKPKKQKKTPSKPKYSSRLGPRPSIASPNGEGSMNDMSPVEEDENAPLPHLFLGEYPTLRAYLAKAMTAGDGGRVVPVTCAFCGKQLGGIKRHIRTAATHGVDWVNAHIENNLKGIQAWYLLHVIAAENFRETTKALTENPRTPAEQAELDRLFSIPDHDAVAIRAVRPEHFPILTRFIVAWADAFPTCLCGVRFPRKDELKRHVVLRIRGGETGIHGEFGKQDPLGGLGIILAHDGSFVTHTNAGLMPVSGGASPNPAIAAAASSNAAIANSGLPHPSQHAQFVQHPMPLPPPHSHHHIPGGPDGSHSGSHGPPSPSTSAGILPPQAPPNQQSISMQHQLPQPIPPFQFLPQPYLLTPQNQGQGQADSQLPAQPQPLPQLPQPLPVRAEAAVQPPTQSSPPAQVAATATEDTS